MLSLSSHLSEYLTVMWHRQHVWRGRQRVDWPDGDDPHRGQHLQDDGGQCRPRGSGGQIDQDCEMSLYKINEFRSALLVYSSGWTSTMTVGWPGASSSGPASMTRNCSICWHRTQSESRLKQNILHLFDVMQFSNEKKSIYFWTLICFSILTCFW